MNITIETLILLGSADLSTLTKRIAAMSEAMDTLITRVSEIETVADSLIEAFKGVKALLDEAIAANDPAALQALSERLAAQA